MTGNYEAPIHGRPSKRNEKHLCTLNLHEASEIYPYSYAHLILLTTTIKYGVKFFKKFIPGSTISNDDVIFLRKIGKHPFYSGIVSRFGNCNAV